MRLAEAGPWWDIAGATAVQDNHEELAVPERRLAKRTASGCVFNSTAPAQLTPARKPVNRLAVARHACTLLDQSEHTPR